VEQFTENSREMYETEKEVKENPAQIKPTPKYKSEPH
jgi:hypothetical protein